MHALKMHRILKSRLCKPQSSFLLYRHHRNISTLNLKPGELIPTTFLIEEETLQDYKPQRYYPVKLNQLFHSRYKTLGKLGYGSASTVWLCQDILCPSSSPSKYVALKVYVNSSKHHGELNIYKHIQATCATCTHDGRHHMRKLLDSFDIDGPHGKHTCLVHEPLGISFDEMKELTTNGLFEAKLIRQTFRPILTGLEFLHKEANIIHTGREKGTMLDICKVYAYTSPDIQPKNMLMGVHDRSAFEKYTARTKNFPMPRKELEDRTIYILQPMPLTKGLPFLTDFSEARFGDSKHTGVIMPNVYRAPEVILDMEWSYPVDVWGLGMTASFLQFFLNYNRLPSFT
jgi:serine/threonine-protein kinase SRPK3